MILCEIIPTLFIYAHLVHGCLRGGLLAFIFFMDPITHLLMLLTPISHRIGVHLKCYSWMYRKWYLDWHQLQNTLIDYLLHCRFLYIYRTWNHIIAYHVLWITYCDALEPYRLKEIDRWSLWIKYVIVQCCIMYAHIYLIFEIYFIWTKKCQQANTTATFVYVCYSTWQRKMFVYVTNKLTCAPVYFVHNKLILRLINYIWRQMTLYHFHVHIPGIHYRIRCVVILPCTYISLLRQLFAWSYLCISPSYLRWAEF